MRTFNSPYLTLLVLVLLCLVGCAPTEVVPAEPSDPGNLTVIDAHSHPLGFSDIATLDQNLEAAGLSGTNLACIALSERTFFWNVEALLIKAAHPDKVWAFAGLIYDPPGGLPKDFPLARQAKLLWEAGFDGMKMIEGKANFRAQIGFGVDDPRYDEYFAFLQDTGIPLLLHQNDDWTHWRNANDMSVPLWLRRRAYFLKKEKFPGGKIPGHEQLYEECERMLDKFPELKVIFAHFYFVSNDIEHARRILDKYHQVCFDLTPAETMYYDFSQNPAEWREFFTRYEDRIVFGTDSGGLGSSNPDNWTIGWMRRFLETRDEFEYKRVMKSKPVTYRFQIRGIGLDKEVLTKIYAGNFQRLAGAKPRPINFDKALEYCRYLKTFAEASENRDKLMPKIQKFIAQLQQFRALANK